MKKRLIASLGVSFLVVAAGASAVAIQEQQMTEEQAKMMEAYMKAGTPGPEHADLTTHEGMWDCAVKSWFDGSSPAMESKAVMNAKMVMGGRYLKGDVVGDAWGDGPKFEGTVYVAFDNVTKTWQSTWIDNMSTAISMVKAPAGGDGKVRTWKGEYPDPMTGKMKRVREVHTVLSPDQWKAESFTDGPDGKEYKAMEILYTRQKKG